MTTAPNVPYLRIHPTDNVLVALQALPAHKTLPVDGQPLPIRQGITAKHKVATERLAPGDPVHSGATGGKSVTNFSLFGMNRRTALSRAALLLGGMLSAPTLLALRQHDPATVSGSKPTPFTLTNPQQPTARPRHAQPLTAQPA